MLDHSVLAFSLIALALTPAPGPDAFLVIANSSAGGFRRGFATVLGIVSGGAFYVLRIGCGLARFLLYSPTCSMRSSWPAPATCYTWLGCAAGCATFGAAAKKSLA
jgi:threonine/homoserine/homoserine lactone efflux protein